MKKYIVLSVIAGIAAGVLFLRQRNSSVLATQPKQTLSEDVRVLSENKKEGSSSEVTKKSLSFQAETNTVLSKSTTRAKASLQEMSQIIAETVRGSHDLESLVSRLQKTGQNPVVTRSGDAATGGMMIVRTKSPLPGTRYFHAQYFTDENNQRFPQHISFEFKPGPTAMSDAVSIATQVFSLREPTERKNDFIQWDLDDDYVLWIKKKSAHDLEDDAFNAYDKSTDIGTVQVTVEIRIHDDDHDHH